MPENRRRTCRRPPCTNPSSLILNRWFTWRWRLPRLFRSNSSGTMDPASQAIDAPSLPAGCGVSRWHPTFAAMYVMPMAGAINNQDQRRRTQQDIQPCCDEPDGGPIYIYRDAPVPPRWSLTLLQKPERPDFNSRAGIANRMVLTSPNFNCRATPSSWIGRGFTARRVPAGMPRHLGDGPANPWSKPSVVVLVVATAPTVIAAIMVAP